MTSYSFYPYLPNGSCLTFMVVDFASDAEALDYGRLALLDHVSAIDVEVWDQDRLVGALGLPSILARQLPRLDPCETGERSPSSAEPPLAGSSAPRSRAGDRSAHRPSAARAAEWRAQNRRRAPAESAKDSRSPAKSPR